MLVDDGECVCPECDQENTLMPVDDEKTIYTYD